MSGKGWLPFVALGLGLLLVVPLITLKVDFGPWTRSVVGSESVHWQAAQAAAKGEFSTETSRGYPAPLYPYLLAPLAHDSPNAVRDARRVTTGVALSLFAVFLFLLVRRRAGPWVAVLTALAGVGTGPLVLGAGSLTPALPAALLSLGALVCVDGKSPKIYQWVFGGALLGSAALFHPLLGLSTALALLAAVLLTRGRKARWQPVLAVAGAFVLVATGLGAWAHIDPIFPQPSGVELYRGHRQGASGVVPRRGDVDDKRWWSRSDYARKASEVLGRRLNAQETDAHWRGEALREAVAHPIAETRRNGVKLLATFQGEPLADDVSPAFVADRSDSMGFSISLWIGRILLPLGLVGLVVGRRRTGAVLWAGVGAGLLAAVWTYVQPDTRLVTAVALAAGFGLWVHALVGGSFRERALSLVLGLIAVGLFGWWPGHGGVPGQGINGDDHYFLGVVYDREGRGSAAMREYERAQRLDPTSPYPAFAVAGMLARDDVLEEAITELERLRENHPDFVTGLVPLAKLYERQQKWVEAASVYGDLARLEPWNPEPLNNLATMYVQTGYYEQAVRALESALAVDPGYQTARENLQALRDRGLAPGPGAGGGSTPDALTSTQNAILTRIQAGDAAGADSLIQAAYRQFGANRAEVAYLEGTLKLSTGDPAGAVRVMEPFRDVMGANVIFLNNLAVAYAQSGRREKARDIWQEALRLQPANERIRRSLQHILSEIDSLAAPR